MSDQLLEEHEQGTNGATDAVEPTKPAEPTSHLSRLRAKRDEKLADKHIDIEIPGYDGELWCRYRPVSWDDLKKIGEKVERMKHARKELLGFCDVLIAACDSFLVREEPGAELEPLNPDDPEPIRYDQRLADALGFTPNQPGSARSIVLGTFGLAVSPELAITAQHNELGEWMEGANVEADEETLGES